MRYFHKCDRTKSLLKMVEIDETNHARYVDSSEKWPIYKPCCHFYKIDKEGKPGREVSMKSKYPKLILE